MPLSVNDKKAIVWIIAIILTANIGMYFYTSVKKDTESAEANLTKTDDTHVTNNKKIKLFYFDPNTADYNTFLSLGLKQNTARAIINYRKAGGVFHSPTDLSRIYTLADSDYLRIAPYVRIKASKHEYIYKKNSERQSRNTPHPSDDRVLTRNENYTSYKLRHGQKIDINTADSTLLQRIPGIGPYYAHKIIRYRNRLGGFVSISQIKEICGIPDDIEQWLSLKNINIARLQVNHSTFGQLLRHPYLSYEQVVAIFNHRKVYGAIHKLDDLANYTAFSQTDFVRLAPYLDFSE